LRSFSKNYLGFALRSKKSRNVGFSNRIPGVELNYNDGAQAGTAEEGPRPFFRVFRVFRGRTVVEA
jgi:hypothetical protein